MNFPISRYLVPEIVQAAPEGWTIVEQRIVAGLPVTLSLSKNIQVRLASSTGLAREWVAGNPRSVVSAASWQLAPHQPGVPPVIVEALAATPVLQVRASVGALGAMPLQPVAARTFARTGAAPTLAEIILLDWQLCAGNLRGAGDYGSFIRLAWRQADQGVPMFGPPPISEFLHRRTPPAQRIESKLGLAKEIKQARFLKRREILK